MGVRRRTLPDSEGQHRLLSIDAAEDEEFLLIDTTVVSTSGRGVTADSGLMRSDGEYGKNSEAAARAETADCGGFVHSSGE